jgi:mannitol-1-phosphate 5-dehydrogenase
MKAVHFGAGNIGRGFIGEILFNNGFSIDFVDINATIIDALKARIAYEIELASEAKERIAVTNVNGLNNQTEPEAVVDAIAEADIVTTAIGPNILPFIAELIAKGTKNDTC